MMFGWILCFCNKAQIHLQTQYLLLHHCNKIKQRKGSDQSLWMFVQITFEILFQNKESTGPGLLIIALTIYHPYQLDGAKDAERMVSYSFRSTGVV